MPYAGGEGGYSNWELSADRANASRRELIAGGMGEAKVLRVLGLASTQNLNKADPLDPENRRISVIVLNRKSEEALMRDDATTTTLSADAAGSQQLAQQPRRRPCARRSRRPPSPCRNPDRLRDSETDMIRNHFAIDDSGDHALLQATLMQAGYDVTVAPDGEAGFDPMGHRAVRPKADRPEHAAQERAGSDRRAAQADRLYGNADPRADDRRQRRVQGRRTRRGRDRLDREADRLAVLVDLTATLSEPAAS